MIMILTTASFSLLIFYLSDVHFHSVFGWYCVLSMHHRVETFPASLAIFKPQCLDPSSFDLYPHSMSSTTSLTSSVMEILSSSGDISWFWILSIYSYWHLLPHARVLYQFYVSSIHLNIVIANPIKCFFYNPRSIYTSWLYSVMLIREAGNQWHHALVAFLEHWRKSCLLVSFFSFCIGLFYYCW